VYVPFDDQGAGQHAVVAAVHGTVYAAVGVLLAFQPRGGTDVVADVVGAFEDTVRAWEPGVGWRVTVTISCIEGAYCGQSQLALQMRDFYGVIFRSGEG